MLTHFFKLYPQLKKKSIHFNLAMCDCLGHLFMDFCAGDTSSRKPGYSIIYRRKKICETCVVFQKFVVFPEIRFSKKN